MNHETIEFLIQSDEKKLFLGKKIKNKKSKLPYNFLVGRKTCQKPVNFCTIWQQLTNMEQIIALDYKVIKINISLNTKY